MQVPGQQLPGAKADGQAVEFSNRVSTPEQEFAQPKKSRSSVAPMLRLFLETIRMLLAGKGEPGRQH
jgi:hypothetical protein